MKYRYFPAILLLIFSLSLLPDFLWAQPDKSPQNITQGKVIEVPSVTQIYPLSISDTIPNLLLTGMLNYINPTANMHDFKGKLLILDFFSRYCGACINELPKLDKLRQEFAGKLEILIIADEPINAIRSFIASNRIAGKVSIPVVTADTLLQKLFPHRMVPHQVWISPKGKIIAITTPKHATASNISAAIKGQPIALPVKNDNITFNRLKPLLVNDNGGSGNELLFRSVVTGYLPGISSGTGVVLDSTLDTRRYFFINRPLMALIIAATGFDSLANRVMLAVSDSSRFLRTADSEKWTQANFFSYEQTLPAAASFARFQMLMLHDIEKIFGLTVTLENRLINCWVISSKPNDSLIQSIPGLHQQTIGSVAINLQNQPVSVLVQRLNHQVSARPITPIVLNETDNSIPVSVSLQVVAGNYRQLQNQLNKYGLYIHPAQRQLSMLVIKNKDEPLTIIHNQ